MRLIVRGYGDGKLVLEERVEFATPDDLEPIANRQLEQVIPYRMHMVEIEFLDDLDPLTRFLRFGTDKRRMVQPEEIFRVKPEGGPS